MTKKVTTGSARKNDKAYPARSDISLPLPPGPARQEPAVFLSARRAVPSLQARKPSRPFTAGYFNVFTHPLLRRLSLPASEEILTLSLLHAMSARP